MIETFRITRSEAERARMFTKKDSDLMKEAGCRLSSRIMDAFHKIEVMDIRVAKIAMPVKAFKILQAEQGGQPYANVPPEGMVAYMHSMKQIALDGGTRGFDTRCSLWGANIVLADQFRVFGEDQTPMSVPVPYYAFMGNLWIHVKSRANPIYRMPANEESAIGTLREIISESDYRKYVTHGFILVPGASGRVYQISRYDRHIKVWNRGVLEEEICVRINDTEVPPTDHVIAFKAIVEYSEEEIHNLGNVYKMAKAA